MPFGYDPPVEFHQLRYFVAAAETGSITAAARREHVTQPALSRQIALLETQLGVKLFERVRQRVVLTDAGRWFLPRAKAYALKHTSTKTGAIRYTTVGAVVPCHEVLDAVASVLCVPLKRAAGKDAPEEEASSEKEISETAPLAATGTDSE